MSTCNLYLFICNFVAVYNPEIYILFYSIPFYASTSLQTILSERSSGGNRCGGVCGGCLPGGAMTYLYSISFGTTDCVAYQAQNRFTTSLTSNREFSVEPWPVILIYSKKWNLLSAEIKKDWKENRFIGYILTDERQLLHQSFLWQIDMCEAGTVA